MVESIVYRKVGEWEKKGFRKKLSIKITKWLEQFDESEKTEMLALLAHYDYYSSNKIQEIVQKLYLKFRQECDSKDVVFTKIGKEIGTSFSSIFFLSFWQYNDLYDYSQEDFDRIVNRQDIPSNIVFVDDYFGTGKTFIKYLSALLSQNPNIKNKKIYFVAQQGSYIGKEKIEEFAIMNQLQLALIVNKYTKKAFEYGYIYKNNAQEHRKLYADIYDKRMDDDSYKFGYEQIEALISFHYNTPNNTLGIFWQNMCGFNALFEIYQKKSTTLNNMRKNVKRNTDIKLGKPYIKDVETYKMDLFMVYCVAKGSTFDAIEACRDFGLTEEQLNNMLNYLIAKNYIICNDGKYESTNELKKYLYASRLKEFKQKYQQNANRINGAVDDVRYVPRNFKDKFKGYNN